MRGQPAGRARAESGAAGGVSSVTAISGRIRARARQLVFDVRTIVSYVSKAMTLLPGDVILTGTPSGVGPLRPGDEVSITIEGIGTLTNTVIAGV